MFSGPALPGAALLLSQHESLGSGTYGGITTGYRPRFTGLGVPAARQLRTGQSESALQQGSLL